METQGIAKLNEVMDRLLGPDGCPWDRAQTHESMKICLLEECYEVLDAIDKQDNAALCEELGDVLMNVMFHAKIAAGFDFNDVANGIADKLMYRHPHIFGDASADTPEAVLANWERLKREEKHHETVTEALRAMPRNLPALIFAQKALKKAIKIDKESFTKENAADALERFAQELRAGEVENLPQILEDFGSVMLHLVYISSIMQINPEFALTNHVETYINKFEDIECRRAAEPEVSPT